MHWAELVGCWSTRPVKEALPGMEAAVWQRGEEGERVGEGKAAYGREPGCQNR